MNKKIIDISDRARIVFKYLVEDYLKNGNPMGSVSIRDNMKLNLSRERWNSIEIRTTLR